MNNHFRNIKENRNIDYIEESDDEDDFHTDCNKYVELKKAVDVRLCSTISSSGGFLYDW
jgi:hypothetical protein